LPTDLAPKSAAHYYFVLWDWEGKLDRGHKAPYVAAREAAGREEASPTAAIIDRQSAKAAHASVIFGCLRKPARLLMTPVL